MSACSAAKFSPGSVGTWYMVVIRVGSGSSSGPGSPTEGYPMLQRGRGDGWFPL
jgi:hypothetical protein